MARIISISQGVSHTLYFPLDQILYFEADGNYTNLYTRTGDPVLVSSQLGVLGKAVSRQLEKDGYRLIRVGRSLIVNAAYVHEIDIAHQALVLTDYAGFSRVLHPSQESLGELAETLERLIAHNLI